MDVINVLDAQVADMIAAGEVVERPASALKELLENALDAGAASVSAEIKNGGVTLIRVSDDGAGISESDLPKAVLRHATSKIKSGADIDGVKTLGFRGEALAAIAAVSKLSIISKRGDSGSGYLLTAEGGRDVKVEEVGCPAGTTVIVEGLFYNTPARRKFLKRDSAEAAACRGVAEKLAVSNPHVAFRFTSDGEEKFSTSGDGKLKNAVADALGGAFAKGLIEVSGAVDEVKVSGYVSSPEASRGNSASQMTFVNGRYVLSKTVFAALREAYKSYLPRDRYPASVLFLTLPFKFVDVNVHPSKTEIKFASERKVYEAVYYAVRSALQRSDAFTGGEDDILLRKGDIEVPAEKPVGAHRREDRRPLPPDRRAMKQSAALFDAESHAPASGESREPTDVVPPRVSGAVLKREDSLPALTLRSPRLGEAFAQAEMRKAPAFRCIGEAFDAYIIAETADALYIIDKHAAHERILYESLRKSTRAESQTLLLPCVAELSASAARCILENAAYLSSLGFDIEEFGEKSVAVRALPAALSGSEDVKALLEQFAESLSLGGALPFEERCDRALFTMACKAALKAGIHNPEHDDVWILERLFGDGGIKYCPHGRPVAKAFTRREADKWFDRRTTAPESGKTEGK